MKHYLAAIPACVLACVLACVPASPLTAQETGSEVDTLRYDVRVLGAKIGVMTIAARMGDQHYSARTLFSTAGLIRVFRKIEADVRVKGLLGEGAMQPATYHEEIDDGTRVTNVDVQFSPGPPRLIAGDTGSKAPPADVSRLGDAVDPLTGLYALLRDQTRDEVCQLSTDIFDGHRLARITADQAKQDGGAVICQGSYQRVDGYSKSERTDRKVPMTIRYVPYGDLLRAERVEIKSRYGPAVINRL